MPGPGAFYGKLLGDAVLAGDVPESELDEHVSHLLQVFDRIGALDDDPAWSSTSIDRPEHRALAREAAIAATVPEADDIPASLPAAAELLASDGPLARFAQDEARVLLRPTRTPGSRVALAPIFTRSSTTTSGHVPTGPSEA